MQIGIEFRLILAVISIAIVLAVIFYILPTFFNINILDFIGIKPVVDDNVFDNPDLSSLDTNYNDYELSHDGMILPRDGGIDSVDSELTAYDTVRDCSGCSSCQIVSFGNMQTLGCDSCSECEDIQEADRFENCIGCDSGTCSICDDTQQYALCNDIKSSRVFRCN